MRIKVMVGLVILAALSGDFSFSQSVPPVPGAAASSALQNTPYAAVSRNANETVWQSTSYEPGPNGTQYPRVHTVRELATGLNHWTGQWVPSSDEISILPDGTAAGTNCGHQVFFPADIYNGTITLLTPSGKILQSQPLGLSYDDGTNTVVIAELTNSIGYLAGSNQVIYPNAFTGISADLLYTYTKAGFEQDVILRGQPAEAPEDFQMDSHQTQLQVLTEFFNPPAPEVTPAALPRQGGLALSDETLNFGDMQMVQGRAYLLGNNAQNTGALVGKSWENVGGRQILVESVPVMALAAELLQLPPSASAKSIGGSVLNVVSSKRRLPAQRLATVPSHHPIQMAQANRPVNGLVLDYNTMTGSLTNYTFQADSTYYVSGALNLYGSNTFEGGTVIKYASGASMTQLSSPQTPLVVFRSGAYRPVVFTAKDDNAVGETISGSSGSPSGYYANPALGLSGAGIQRFSDFRILYAQTGLSLSGTSVTNYDAQFVRCGTGISLSSSNDFVGNALFLYTGTNFVLGSGAGMVGQNITFNGANVLMTNAAGGATLTLTNCILVNVTNDSGALYAANNGFYNSSTFGSGIVTIGYYPFTTVGEGQNYLTNGLSFIGAGTSNVDPTLLALLAKKTVNPPFLYSNTTISTSTTFSPQATRDTNTISLGYHYDPIDYFFGGVTANSNVTFTAGTAMGWFELPGNGGPGYGLALKNNMTCAFSGALTNPCVDARYSTVQEGGDGLWKDKGWLAGIIGHGSVSTVATASIITANFTHFAMLAGEPLHVRDYNAALIFQPINCEFYSGGMGAYWVSYYVTNCLFDRCNFQQVQGESGNVMNAINCTVHGTILYLNNTTPIPILIENCAFDGTTFNTSGYGGNATYDTYDYNAYTNGAGVLPVGGSHNVIVTNGFNWQSSWFGSYYLPTNSPVIDKGNTNANYLGLYHFTTQTNQIPETNSIVDIGYHYVATDTNGNPLDSNGDGVPDYLEDGNGDGVVDNGETNWALAILVQPASQNAYQWDTVTFSVTAAGVAPIHYQWYSNTTAVAGTTGSTFTLNSVQTNATGNYYVIVTNNYGSTTSSNAVLTVSPPPPERIGYWRFNNPPVWSDEQGLLPSTALGLAPSPSWSGYAVHLGSAQNGNLAYPCYRTNGSPVVTLPTGSIRFWYKPDWSTYDGLTNLGPQDTIRLFEIGEQSTNAGYGWFAITINSRGTALTFSTESSGIHTDNAVCPIQFATNSWYQITLTYTPTNSALYVDGVPVVTNGFGVTNFPGTNVLQQGFHLGCSWDEVHQANGRFDELETFNYPLSATSVATNYQAIMSVDTDGDGVPDVTENAIGSRPDAWDSDCDGIPDGWELAHGMNPVDPSDATQARLNEYMGVTPTVVSGWTRLGQETISDVSEGGTFSFGSFPPGYYIVCYTNGTWQCFPGSWVVDQIAYNISTNTHSITVNYNLGTGEDSGNAIFDGPTSSYMTSAAAQAAAQGSATFFLHQGGDISLSFLDSPYDDNSPGIPGPTYVLYAMGPVFGVSAVSTLWLNSTQCQATFTITNYSAFSWTGITVTSSNLNFSSVVTNVTGPVTGWSISSNSTAQVSFTLDTTPAEKSQITSTLQFSNGTNAFPDVEEVLGLQARPGNQAVYVVWPPILGATNYSVYQSVGNTNSWTFIGSTTNLYFPNTNLTVGTTYYYKVSALGTNWISAGAVPFGCPDPLPPLIDYVDTLQIPAINNAYPLNNQILLTNSDAFDPQGYPMTFAVDSVVSGSLLINGLPYSSENNVIGTNSVVWVPPASWTPPGTPAFNVYVFDAYNRSTNTVDVVIFQHPQPHLMGWGFNFGWGSAGGAQPLGTGTINLGGSQGDDTGQPWTALGFQAVLSAQQWLGVLTNDPRWTLNFNYPTDLTSQNADGDAPTQIMGLDQAISIGDFYDFNGPAHYFITPDHKMYFSGFGCAYAIGQPLVYHETPDDTYAPTNGALVDWDSSLLGIYPNDWTPFYVLALSPVPFVDPDSQLPYTNVLSTDNGLILKDDGSLWSMGVGMVDVGNDQLGREPTASDDAFSLPDVGILGVRPERVQFPGNSVSGIVPGREVVEVHASAETAGIARCKDGSVWWWGLIRDGLRNAVDTTFEWQLPDITNSDNWSQPVEYTNVETASISPITQISVAAYHFMILRQDGSVSEFGYVPALDPSDSEDNGFNRDPRPFYTNSPMAVPGLPGNVVQISAGPRCATAVTADGDVWVWGQWVTGYIGAPQKIPGLENIVKACIGENGDGDGNPFVVALDKKGALWGAGHNGNGVFGFVDGAQTYTNAIRVQGIENVSDMFVPITADGIAQQVYAIGTKVQNKPVNLVAIPMNQSVQLQWDVYPGASSYLVYRSLNENAGYVAIGQCSTNVYFDQSPPLQNGQTYYYEVFALVNGVQTAPSWDVSATPLPLPTVALSVSATPDCHAIDLTWSAPANAAQSNPSEYMIYRSTNSSSGFAPIAYCPATPTFYVDGSVADGQTYYYEVVPANTAGSPSGNAIVSTTNNPATCAPSPQIPSDWLQPSSSWFTVAGPQNWTDTSDHPTLYWTSPTNGDWLLTTNDLINWESLVTDLVNSNDTLSGVLWSRFSSGVQADLTNVYTAPGVVLADLTNQLNPILEGPSIYDSTVFSGVNLRAATASLLAQNPTGTNLVKLNRMLFDDYYNYHGIRVMDGPSWGPDLTGFRLYYHYQLPNGQDSGPLWQDISVSDAISEVQTRTGLSPFSNDWVNCYNYTWILPTGMKDWAAVAAIVNGQAGESSIEVGPYTSSQPPGTWQVTPRAVPGYQQVYLDWPDDERIAQFGVECTALVPGVTASGNDLFDYNDPTLWVTLGNSLLTSHYWHMGITATNFTPVDFKYVTDLVTSLTNSANPVSAALWNQFSSTATNALLTYNPGTSDVNSIRSLLASELTRLIQVNSNIFNPTAVGLTDPSDLSTTTKNLLSSNSLPLSAHATLNRLLLEDAYVHDIARYETPSPVGFVSGDITGVQNILQKFPCGATGFQIYDPVAQAIWNNMPDVTNQIMTDISNYNGGDPAYIQSVQRFLAATLTRFIQTNALLVDTNLFSPGNAYEGIGISDRTMTLASETNSLTTNQWYLLNRLLIQDAWNQMGFAESTYYLEPLSDLRYYWVDAYFCDDFSMTPYPSYWVGARPDDQAPAPAVLTNFTAQAFPYDSAALVQWTIPGATSSLTTSNTAWQFSLERKVGTNGDYLPLGPSQFGSSYLDSGLTDGQTYQYRVSAYDPSYNLYQAETAPVTPTNGTSLTLFAPQAGNAYVGLSWTPIPATQYNILRSTSPYGSFTNIATLNVSTVYLGAQNTYQDVDVQNGVTEYYEVTATTPTGYVLSSQVQSATPLATLAPLPPKDFRGVFVPDNWAGQIQLSWVPRVTDQGYQVFLVDPTRMIPLPNYNGISPNCVYELPLNTPPQTGFTFAIRAITPTGLASDVMTTTVSNRVTQWLQTAPKTVLLQVAGTPGPNLSVIGPTNLTLSAVVNAPEISQVSFYDGATLIGTASQAPYQITWYQVPAGTHSVTAVALVDGDVASYVGSGNSATLTSDPFSLTVNIEPQLSAYQTSATDLQLPAPSLPISLARSYTSRSVTTNGLLGIGWTAVWSSGSVKLGHYLTNGWSGVTNQVSGSEMCYISDSAGHDATVTLPSGQTIQFATQLQFDNTVNGSTPAVEQNPAVQLGFQPYAVNSGTLTNSLNILTLTNPISDDFTNWGTDVVTFAFANLSQLTYTDPSGTVYSFGQPAGDGVTWFLTQIMDRSSNTLNYVYDANTNLVAISNSCGRQVTFTYTPTTYGSYHGTNISVFDPNGGSSPVVIYVVSNNLLTQVHQLVSRSPATYITNWYVYGNNSVDTNNFNRLTSVYDARGVRMLQNIYTNSSTTGGNNGDLVMQISPGKTNVFQIDTNHFDVTVTTTTSTVTNTVQVLSDASGAIAGATQPVSGGSPSTVLATATAYDTQGNLVGQTDANGNTKTYSYDSQNRLVGQTDANGNSTYVELNQYGQATNSFGANGQNTSYAYDDAGNTISTVDPSGTSTSYTYSPPLTGANTNTYVGAQQTSESQVAPYVPYTIITTNVYDGTNAILGDLVQATEEWVDGNGNVVGTPVTTIYGYDANGNRTNQIQSRTVPGGMETIVTGTTYDAQNRVVTTTVSATVNGSQSLAPQITTVTYNSLGKQATSTDAAGRVTTNIYDFNGNQIETDYPDGTVSRTEYDALGRPQYAQDRAVPDGSGNTIAPATYSIYDASGRVIETERCSGVELTKSTATAGTDFVALGTIGTQYKLIVASQGTALSTNLTFYDTVGNVQYSVDGRGTVTQNQYDANGQRTNVLVYTGYTFTQSGTNTPNPTGAFQSTSYTYDADGNQVTMTDAKGNTTTSVYDSNDRLIEEDFPAANGGTVSQLTAYDGLGRKIQETDEAGVAKAYTYDFRGLLTSVTLAAGTRPSR